MTDSYRSVTLAMNTCCQSWCSTCNKTAPGTSQIPSACHQTWLNSAIAVTGCVDSRPTLAVCPAYSGQADTIGTSMLGRRENKCCSYLEYNLLHVHTMCIHTHYSNTLLVTLSFCNKPSNYVYFFVYLHTCSSCMLAILISSHKNSFHQQWLNRCNDLRTDVQIVVTGYFLLCRFNVLFQSSYCYVPLEICYIPSKLLGEISLQLLPAGQPP